MPPECADDGSWLLHAAEVGCTWNLELTPVIETAKRGSQAESDGLPAQRLPPPLQRAYFSAIPMVLDVPSLKEPGMRAPSVLLVSPGLLGSPNTSLLIA